MFCTVTKALPPQKRAYATHEQAQRQRCQEIACAWGPAAGVSAAVSAAVLSPSFCCSEEPAGWLMGCGNPAPAPGALLGQMGGRRLAGSAGDDERPRGRRTRARRPGSLVSREGTVILQLPFQVLRTPSGRSARQDQDDVEDNGTSSSSPPALPRPSLFPNTKQCRPTAPTLLMRCISSCGWG